MGVLHEESLAHRELLRWASSVADDDIHAPVLARAAGVIADSIACMIAAGDEPEVARFHAQLLARNHTPEATLFRGGRCRTDRHSAAVGNALADVWHELEEGWRIVPCHAGLYVLPALLAEAEARAVATRRVLACTAIAYEVVTRFAATWDFPEMADQGRGWVHARFNGIGAAVATALARNASPELAAAAVENAVSMALVGPRRHHLEGALVWNAWPAAATWIGMTSVDWAECGITGLPGTPVDVFGIEYRGRAAWPKMTAGLGEHWAIMDGYTKIHACIQHAHSTVEAVLQARAALRAAGDDVRGILVETHPLALFLDQPEPATSLAAKFSLQHIVATTFVHGDAGATAFAAASLADPAVAALRRKVRFAPFGATTPPHDRPARVTIELADGTCITRTCLSAEGGPDRPFGEDVVWAKIASLTHGAHPDFAHAARGLARLDPECVDAPWPAFLARALAA